MQPELTPVSQPMQPHYTCQTCVSTHFEVQPSVYVELGVQTICTSQREFTLVAEIFMFLCFSDVLAEPILISLAQILFYPLYLLVAVVREKILYEEVFYR